jgi:tRNA-dihydrouridine synthase A
MVYQLKKDFPHWYGIARHMLGLRHGMPRARKWRQVWSDHRNKTLSPREVMQLAGEWEN